MDGLLSIWNRYLENVKGYAGYIYTTRRLKMNDDPGHDAAEDIQQTESDDHYGDMADADDN